MMVAKLQRKGSPRRTSRSAAAAGRKTRTRATPTASQRANQIGRMIAIGSMVAAGMLVVIGAGAIVLLATEPKKRSGKWGGWNFADLSNSARESLRASIPSDWRRTVRDEYLPEAREFVTRQARRFS
jgi:hypothetical protein